MTTLQPDRGGYALSAPNTAQSSNTIRDIILSAEVRLQSRGIDSVFCAFRDGTLTLSGQVSSERLRGLAALIVRGTPGVRAIEDHLVVIEAVG